jgi:hypothetical protein
VVASAPSQEIGLLGLEHCAAPAAGDPRSRQARRLEAEPARTDKALRELAIENTLLGKSKRCLIGPIRGARLPADIKRFIVGAITEAK